jgi:Cell wall-associated hydrolases (invasion-associated proteins)
MAGHWGARRLFRPAVLVAVTATVLGLLPGIGGAAPTDTGSDRTDAPQTVAEVQREIATLGRQLDAVTEQYNGAVLRLGEAREARSLAEANQRKVDARLRHHAGEFRVVASATYRSGPFSEVVSMLSSGSPGEFLDRLSMLDTLSQRRHRIIDEIQAARSQAQAAAQAAAQATAEAERIAADLETKKSWISQQIPRQQALLVSLTADQRAAALNPTDRADRADSRVPVSTAPATGRAAVAVSAALSKLGSPYVWAAAGPDSFDCSGLMLWAWAQAGVALPHYTGDQYAMGTHVAMSELQPGDLVFFYESLSHVGMYIGGGNVVHAPQPGDVVKIASVDSFPFAGATRVG